MFNFFYLTASSLILSILFVVFLFIIAIEKYIRKLRKQPLSGFPEPPSPLSLPIIGHLHLLGGYEVPYQAFTNLGKKYGNVVKLQLGNVNSVVINGQETIREVLVTKGHHFDSRPSFERYRLLFGGDKANSLAFCDWSETQRVRREMLRTYTFPRAFSNKFSTLEDIIAREVSDLSSRIPVDSCELKPFILQSCANIFTSHFCTASFANDNQAFNEMIKSFDEIFYEVNQGYAADFLPFLLPLHYSRISRMTGLTHKVRNFITEHIIGDRFNNFDGDEPNDYVESLIHNVKNEEDPATALSWNSALFALEDIIGGHSAVGNFIVKLLAFLVNEPEVQVNIQNEIDTVTNKGNGFRRVCISDRTFMPYTDGAIFEAIRLIASPIVPRAANQDTSINGYKIEKNTLVFLNNYDLSMSEKLWEEPEAFKPERFIINNHIVKPEYFLPFGGGKRSCMGYKMVQLVSFGILSGLLQNYTIVPVKNQAYKVPVGLLALPTKNTYKFKFVRR